MMLHISVWFVQNDTTQQCLVCTKALATITRIYLHLGNNNEKLELPERLSTGIQFRFRNLFHGKKSGNRNFIC
jgi:hypothetical protein